MHSKTPINKFSPLNEYFDGIFVITLKGYEARQESIKQSLDGLNFEFWAGTDKRELSPDVLENKALYDDEQHKSIKRTHRSMNLAEYACAMSHRRIYEHMIEHKLQKVLIFEDDAVVNDAEIINFEKEMRSLADDWDVILFDYYDTHFPSLKSSIKKSIYKLFHYLHISNWHTVPLSLIDRMCMEDFNQYFYHAGRLSGAHAYALTLEAAKKYIKYQTPVVLQADRIFYYYQQEEALKVYAAKRPKFLRGELHLQSSIQKR